MSEDIEERLLPGPSYMRRLVYSNGSLGCDIGVSNRTRKVHKTAMFFCHHEGTKINRHWGVPVTGICRGPVCP